MYKSLISHKTSVILQSTSMSENRSIDEVPNFNKIVLKNLLSIKYINIYINDQMYGKAITTKLGLRKIQQYRKPNPIYRSTSLRRCRAFTSRHVDRNSRLVLAQLLPEAISNRNGETALILKPILEEKSDIGRCTCKTRIRRKISPKRRDPLIARSLYISCCLKMNGLYIYIYICFI